jgi:hypothetical protein
MRRTLIVRLGGTTGGGALFRIFVERGGERAHMYGSLETTDDLRVWLDVAELFTCVAAFIRFFVLCFFFEDIVGMHCCHEPLLSQADSKREASKLFLFHLGH